MIESTDEMVQLVYEQIDFVNHGDDGIREGLAAVLAIVERDYIVTARRFGITYRCARCNEQATTLVGSEPDESPQSRLLVEILGQTPKDAGPVLLCDPHADEESDRRVAKYGAVTTQRCWPGEAP